MFWNDIAEIKSWMTTISSRMTELQIKMDGIVQEKEDGGFIRQEINDAFDKVFESDDEFNSINRIHDKLIDLVNDIDRKQQVLLAEKTIDKFEDYMKNVDKLNGMINEFKGCVSLARSAIEDRKELEKQTEETKKLAKISSQIYEAMASFVTAGENIKHEAHFKIDYIYKNIEEIADFMQKQAEKSRKRTKRAKKRRTISQSL